MPLFPYFITVLLFLATIAAQTPPTPPTSPSPPTTTSPPGRKRGHHRRNAAKFFGYVRKTDMAWFNNQTLIADEFMHAHNWVRAQYQLPLYTWDEKLASYARGYLMQRYEDCKLIHSSSEYGENMFWGGTCIGPLQMRFIIGTWRRRILIPRAMRACQHCHNPGGGMLMACEYDPPGNFVNENPFESHT
ncbi:CAP domain [Sesbania bispinosa]|nr:CAP domain [Sesbania bispinosa]